MAVQGTLTSNRLRDAVAIKSVSAWTEEKYRNEIVKMVNHVKDEIIRLGGEVELVDLGPQQGKNVHLPPALLGTLGKDSAKKTLCIYGHLDVQPANLDDGWNTEPFELTEIDGKLYGRGSTDDKFVFEGMEESGSEGLDELIFKRKDTAFFKSVDYICISDNYWLGKNKPCITYGLRGICYFFVEVTCASKDLHSGVFGGTVHEAMSDLIYLLGHLVDVKGKILVPGINDNVAPLTDGERATYTDIDFDKVIGKFSIRLVPDMTPKRVEEQVCKYLNELHEKRGSPNDIE
ncbi:Cytosolic non-specific dipeptidase [Acropora cervicornis]|uniref:Cytosolic non-specific dipeptidase n=1 Tax=Acropora cervicornis TaxID=6130 RepID=A0AAD9QY42_ACRCE|nr:Cytosolic non-specific dipeptidase [Acropora cervicornis]